MNDADFILAWSFVAIIVVGLFLCFVRCLHWYSDRFGHKYDPLEPPDFEYQEVSLRRDK